MVFRVCNMKYSSKESILHFKIDNKRMISALKQRNGILFGGFVIRFDYFQSSNLFKYHIAPYSFHATIVFHLE